MTLIEVMIVVVILGVLAAIALPALGGYLKIARTSEATTNINDIFKVSASFYAREQTRQGMQGANASACIVQPTSLIPNAPTNQKQKFIAEGGFKDLGFSIGDLVFYGYGISSIATSALLCGVAPSTTTIYTFYANGDVDGDGTMSTFSLAVGTDPNNELFHGRGFYVVNPVE